MTEGHKITAKQLQAIRADMNAWGWTVERLGDDSYLGVLAAMINHQFSQNQLDDFERSH